VDSLCSCAYAIRDLEKGLNDAMAHVRESAQVQDERFEEIERCDQIIAARIGNEPKEFEGSTVWEGIATLPEQQLEIYFNYTIQSADLRTHTGSNRTHTGLNQITHVHTHAVPCNACTHRVLRFKSPLEGSFIEASKA
jgi:radical SAM superfamily enzyme